MDRAESINLVIHSFVEALQVSAPNLSPLSLGQVQWVFAPDAYGSLILSALVEGALHTKITLTLEWATVFQIAEHYTKKKADSLSPEIQECLEAVFGHFIDTLRLQFEAAGEKLAFESVPTLVDSRALLNEEAEEGGLKIPFSSGSYLINLYLSQVQR